MKTVQHWICAICGTQSRTRVMPRDWAIYKTDGICPDCQKIIPRINKIISENEVMKRAIKCFFSDYDDPKTNSNDMGSPIEALRETIK